MTIALSVNAQEGDPVFVKHKELMAKKPDIQGKNVRVWNIKKTDIIRINLVEMSGELGLHKHPDAEHSLLVLKGKVRVKVGDKFVVMKKGDFISIPKDVPHKYWSLSKKSLLVSMDAPYYDPKKTVRLEN